MASHTPWAWPEKNLCGSWPAKIHSVLPRMLPRFNSVLWSTVSRTSARSSVQWCKAILSKYELSSQKSNNRIQLIFVLGYSHLSRICPSPFFSWVSRRRYTDYTVDCIMLNSNRLSVSDVRHNRTAKSVNGDKLMGRLDSWCAAGRCCVLIPPPHIPLIRLLPFFRRASPLRELRKFEYRACARYRSEGYLRRIITARWRQLVALANHHRCRWPPPTKACKPIHQISAPSFAPWPLSIQL